MDLELVARKKKPREAEEKIKELLLFSKNISEKKAKDLAKAIVSEVGDSMKKPGNAFLETLFGFPKSGVGMGDFGVGCRGRGDFFVHRLIAQLCGSGEKILGPKSQDDGGSVVVKKMGAKKHLVVAVDGTHSRLAYFPFLAGFHVARAAIRDVWVMGAEPKALFVDLHLADDGDIAMLFDYMAGVSLVSEETNVPVVAGSTLRVGGDMVVGERMVSGVGCVGLAERLTPRKNIKPDDHVVLTEGAGGGTITTTALFSGKHEAVLETLNLDFSSACRVLFEKKFFPKIHAMTDVTNGGLRGDADQIIREAKIGMVIDEDRFLSLVNPVVLKMLREKNVDPLGVSLDMLMIFAPKNVCEKIVSELSKKNIRAAVVGKVGGKKLLLKNEKGIREAKTLFRESAYTPIKKLVGEEGPGEEKRLEKKINRAFGKVVDKKEKLRRFLRGKR